MWVILDVCEYIPAWNFCRIWTRLLRVKFPTGLIPLKSVELFQGRIWFFIAVCIFQISHNVFCALQFPMFIEYIDKYSKILFYSSAKQKNKKSGGSGTKTKILFLLFSEVFGASSDKTKSQEAQSIFTLRPAYPMHSLVLD